MADTKATRPKKWAESETHGREEFAEMNLGEHHRADSAGASQKGPTLGPGTDKGGSLRSSSLRVPSCDGAAAWS